MACCSRKNGAAGRPTVFGGDRPCTMDVPEAFDANKTYPILMCLHGRGMTAIQGRNTCGCQTARNFGDGMFVLYPQGLLDAIGTSFWRATVACCNFYGSDVDDIGYGLSLFEEVAQAGWPIDWSRVGLLGYSNGGFLAHMMARCSNKADGLKRITWACALNGMGPLPGDPLLCTPVIPWHHRQVNGTLDVTVKYDGGPGGVPVGPYPGALASAAAIADLFGVTGPLGDPYDTRDFCQPIAGSETTRRRYSGAPANGSVEVWTMVGEDHVVAQTTGPNPMSSWTMSILQDFVDNPRVSA